MKPNIEGRAGELLENQKRLDEEARAVAKYSKQVSRECRLPIFLDVVDKAGLLTGPYWRKSQKYTVRTGERAGQEQNGSVHFAESITRSQLYKIRRLRPEQVREIMELNETAKYLRVMRRVLSEAKMRAGRTLQSANQLYADMFGNYRNERKEALKKQISNFKRSNK